MARREKKPVHKVVMTEGKRKHLFSNFFRSMILKPLKISRMLLRICLLAHHQRDDGSRNG